jgi:acyl-CoA reductase-like NAD-dependent aldehyde dehydrogenase
VIAPEASGLAGLVSVIAPIIAGGNTCVVLASNSQALSAITLAEVLHTSDLPGGVVNLITGDRSELLEHFASHMDVNALVYCGSDANEIEQLRTHATGNLKRTLTRDRTDWLSDKAQSPYDILDTVEIKTTWHPIGV